MLAPRAAVWLKERVAACPAGHSLRLQLPPQPAVSAINLLAAAPALAVAGCWCRVHWLRARRAGTRRRGGCSALQAQDPEVGVVLVNIGTPVSTSVEDVRDYLSRFLGNQRVMDIQDAKSRQKAVDSLLSSRPAISAEKYRRIWHPVHGSPLLHNTEQLRAALQGQLGDRYEVHIGFQYSEPSLATALKTLAERAGKIVLIPMFPHFAQATVAASLVQACEAAVALGCASSLKVVRPFYKSPGYIEAVSQLVGRHVGDDGRNFDHIVFSFHGIPERQCTSTDDTETVCSKVPDCCSRRSVETRNCYRSQCLETAELVARRLGLPEGSWSMSFQSRAALRREIEWTRPYTDELLASLPGMGLRRVALCSPSFTADCIETLGELGHDCNDIFLAAGGKELCLIPSVNSWPCWVRSVADMVRVTASDQASPGTGGFWAM
mmetsp:Transcript_30074/g.65593  ORF Transcript_30074/g.65593 Transcript_30074/m.65593 type:complete len:436 (+) Transcript_30074:39-1346(+)